MPVVADKISWRPSIIGTTMRVQIVPGSPKGQHAPDFNPAKVRVRVMEENGRLLFSYRRSDLHKRSMPNWKAFCGWCSVVAEVVQASGRDDEDDDESEDEEEGEYGDEQAFCCFPMHAMQLDASVRATCSRESAYKSEYIEEMGLSLS